MMYEKKLKKENIEERLTKFIKEIKLCQIRIAIVNEWCEYGLKKEGNVILLVQKTGFQNYLSTYREANTK